MDGEFGYREFEEQAPWNAPFFGNRWTSELYSCK